MFMRGYLFLALGILSLLSGQVSAADPSAWLPKEVNAVVRINSADLFQTPLAKKEGWVKKSAESFIEQESFIPPGTNQIVVGAELDLSDNLIARRKYSILVPDAGMSLEKLSPWLPGGIETLAGKKSAQFGNDGYVVDAGDGCWLTTSSASRQLMSRWLKNGPMSGGAHLSSYLRSALKTSPNSAQVVMAIDLQDNFSAGPILDELKNTGWFSNDFSAKNASEILESIHGATLSFTVGTERTGNIVIDFGRDATSLKPIIEKLVAGVMSRLGASSDDIDGWKWTIKEGKVTGAGSVSPGGIRQVLSLMDPPSITHAISASAAPAEATPEDKMAKTTLKYCKSVQVLLDDLRSTLNKSKDNQALYFERYGRKVDDLPKLNVDPAMLDFGLRISSSLRYQGQTERMHKINAGTRKEQTSSSYASNAYYGNVGPYNSGWNSYSSVEGPAVIGAEENQASKAVRFSEWKQIEDGLVAIRRAMTEKYKIEF